MASYGFVKTTNGDVFNADICIAFTNYILDRWNELDVVSFQDVNAEGLTGRRVVIPKRCIDLIVSNEPDYYLYDLQEG